MSKPQFDIDSVLDNIKSKLQEREVSLGNDIKSDDDFIELTDVVYDKESDFDKFSPLNDNDNSLSDVKNADNISDVEDDFLSENAKKEVQHHLEGYIKKITAEQISEGSKIEGLIRQEARKALQVWMEKNLALIVKEQVSNEINKITKTYMK